MVLEVLLTCVLESKSLENKRSISQIKRKVWGEYNSERIMMKT